MDAKRAGLLAARRPQHIAGGRRKHLPQVVQVALLPPARGPSWRGPLPPFSWEGVPPAKEKGFLLAVQGYLRNSPAAHPGCGLTLCNAVMPPHPRNSRRSRCSLELSIVETVHAAE